MPEMQPTLQFAVIIAIAAGVACITCRIINSVINSFPGISI